MSDLDTRIGDWLTGTIRPGPDGGWVADARWTGLDGMVFVLPDEATQTAYLDRAQPLAVRAVGAQSLAQLLSAIGTTLLSASLLFSLLGSDAKVGPTGVLFGAVVFMGLGITAHLPTWFGSMGLRAWLRRAGIHHPGRSAPPHLPPLAMLQARTLLALMLVTLSGAVMGCVMLFSTLDWTGWFWTPVGGFGSFWVAVPGAVICLGGAAHCLGEIRRLLRLRRS